MEAKKFIFLFTFFILNNLYSNEKKFNIGYLIVATGRYIEFVKPLIESAKKYFLKKHNVKFFVFTDDKNIQSTNEIVILTHSRLGWPFDTMNRYHVYYKYKDCYEKMDYLFATDADYKFINFVGDEILGERVAIQHPGFVGKRGSYETNVISKAYVAPKEGTCYFAGGICGGTKNEFLKLAKTIYENVDEDLKKKYIAIWHDESHLNRYFINFKPTVILTPEYGWPEEIKTDRKIKGLFLLKNHNDYRK